MRYRGCIYKLHLTNIHCPKDKHLLDYMYTYPSIWRRSAIKYIDSDCGVIILLCKRTCSLGLSTNTWLGFLYGQVTVPINTLHGNMQFISFQDFVHPNFFLKGSQMCVLIYTVYSKTLAVKKVWRIAPVKRLVKKIWRLQ